MKRTAGIILLVVYLFSFAEFHNLLKLPVLIEHFREHKKEDPSITFWSFIRIHYSDPLVVDDDYQRDQQLPFRDADCCMVTGSIVCECLPMAVGVQPPAEPVTEFYLTDENRLPLFSPFGIFQPPRCA